MEKKDKKIIAAEIGIIFVAMFWGMGFVAAKFVLKEMGPFDLLGYRYLLSFIVMLFFSLGHLKKLDKKTLKLGILIGMITYAGIMLQTYGLQFTTPGKQTFITCMYTVLVPLLSWIFYKEKIPSNMITAACISFIGIGLLTLQDDLTIGFGDGITFIWAIFFSVQVIIIGRYASNTDPFNLSTVQLGTCAVLGITTSFLLGDGLSLHAMLSLSTSSHLGMIELVLFNTVLAFFIQTICQKIAPAHHVAILMSTETVFGTFFAVTLTGEVFQGRMLIGCALMFIAIIVSNVDFSMFSKRQKLQKQD